MSDPQYNSVESNSLESVGKKTKKITGFYPKKTRRKRLVSKEYVKRNLIKI